VELLELRVIEVEELAQDSVGIRSQDLCRGGLSSARDIRIGRAGPQVSEGASRSGYLSGSSAPRWRTWGSCLPDRGDWTGLAAAPIVVSCSVASSVVRCDIQAPTAASISSGCALRWCAFGQRSSISFRPTNSALLSSQEAEQTVSLASPPERISESRWRRERGLCSLRRGGMRGFLSLRPRAFGTPEPEPPLLASRRRFLPSKAGPRIKRICVDPGVCKNSRTTCQRKGEARARDEYEMSKTSKGMPVRIWSRAPARDERLRPLAVGAFFVRRTGWSGLVRLGI